MPSPAYTCRLKASFLPISKHAQQSASAAHFQYWKPTGTIKSRLLIAKVMVTYVPRACQVVKGALSQTLRPHWSMQAPLLSIDVLAQMCVRL